MKEKHDMQQMIGQTLRWGVSIACLIALIGGGCYLFIHGNEPIPNYSTFVFDKESSYITIDGIISGILALDMKNWIQFGVVILILTPIIRILLSLLEFVSERDWLYVGITLVVFLVILFNSLEGA